MKKSIRRLKGELVLVDSENNVSSGNHGHPFPARVLQSGISSASAPKSKVIAASISWAMSARSRIFRSKSWS